MQAYKKLKYYINKFHYNQSALANAIGMTPSTLHMKLIGERKLNADEFIDLCKHMGVDVNRIIDYDVPEEECNALVAIEEETFEKEKDKKRVTE